jgi:hypothetical protein
MQDQDRKDGGRQPAARGNPSMRQDDRGTPARQKTQDPDQRGGDMPPQRDRPAAHQPGAGESLPAPVGGPAAGSIDQPIQPGEYQAGDLSEQAQQLGGPVDVFPNPGHQKKERPAG